MHVECIEEGARLDRVAEAVQHVHLVHGDEDLRFAPRIQKGAIGGVQGQAMLVVGGEPLPGLFVSGVGLQTHGACRGDDLHHVGQSFFEPLPS